MAKPYGYYPEIRGNESSHQEEHTKYRLPLSLKHFQAALRSKQLSRI